MSFTAVVKVPVKVRIVSEIWRINLVIKVSSAKRKNTQSISSRLLISKFSLEPTQSSHRAISRRKICSLGGTHRQGSGGS